jgi:type I restriction enzyme M protein
MPPSTPSSTDGYLNVAALESWLWEAACVIRGATDAPKFKDFILPLIFYKRLSDVFDDEFESVVQQFGEEAIARAIIEADHADALKEGRKPIVRFYIPHHDRWGAVRNHGADGHLGEFITSATRRIAELNPDLQGVIDIKDFNERQSGQRTLDDDRLAELVEVVSRHRLGLKNAEADILGRAYEYLLRKFAEGQGQSAGEFYTPKEVGWLMAKLLDPAPYTHIYDPACGSAGLLIKARLHFDQHHPNERSKGPHLYGQELNPVTFAIAKMNMFLHGYTDASFAIGDTFRNPGFAAAGAGLKRFDYVIANPMWNQDTYDSAFYEADKEQWNRFIYGTPPNNTADWGWIQHMVASLKESGRAAVVLDTGAVSRGSGTRTNHKERTIRKALVEADNIEGVVLLPENLFYNTTAPGIVLLLNRTKPSERQGQILLVNASAYFVKEKPKNVLTQAGIETVAEVYCAWESRERLSHVITLEEARKADYNLSPSQFVTVTEQAQHRPLGAILSDLDAARLEREQADADLSHVLHRLGLDGKE